MDRDNRPRRGSVCRRQSNGRAGRAARHRFGVIGAHGHALRFVEDRSRSSRSQPSSPPPVSRWPAPRSIEVHNRSLRSNRTQADGCSADQSRPRRKRQLRKTLGRRSPTRRISPQPRVVPTEEKPNSRSRCGKTKAACARSSPRPQTPSIMPISRSSPTSSDRSRTLALADRVSGDIAPARAVSCSKESGRKTTPEATAVTASDRFSTASRASPATTWADPAAPGRSTRTSKSSRRPTASATTWASPIHSAWTSEPDGSSIAWVAIPKARRSRQPRSRSQTRWPRFTPASRSRAAWCCTALEPIPRTTPGASRCRAGTARSRSGARSGTRPPLFGAGRIDAIPDEAIEAAARRQSSGSAQVKGRVSRLKDGRIGRFGWKAQTATLEEFVLSAAAGEIGLEVPGRHQAADPRLPGLAATGLDMDQDECNLLIDYVRNLPVPVATKPADDKDAAQIKAGEATFKSIGCASCHLPKLGEVEGIYSDLLLHDMGPQLADADTYTVFAGEPPRADRPEPADRARPRTDAASAREWRTPPLWGLRDSGPYLHDGRAAGIAEAITLHAGQGAASARRFAELPPGASNNSRRSSCRSPLRHGLMTNSGSDDCADQARPLTPPRRHLTGDPPSSCNRRRRSQIANWSSRWIASPSSNSSSVATRTQHAICSTSPPTGSRHSPASCHSVGARRRKPPVVGIKCQRMHRPSVHKRRADRQTGLGIPEPDRSIPARRRDDRASAVERQAINRPLMRERFSDRSKRLRIPEPGSPILARRRDRPAARAVGNATRLSPKGKLRQSRPASPYPRASRDHRGSRSRAFVHRG